MPPRLWAGAVVAVLGLALLLVLRGTLRLLARRRWGAGWSAACVLIAFVVMYGISSFMLTSRGPWQPSEFPHYLKLADAFLNGRLHLLEPLFEVYVHQGRVYVMEPVFPAVLLAPCVAVWGSRCSDTLVLILLSAVNVALCYAVMVRLRRWPECRAMPETAPFWLAVLFGLGTPHWYLAIAGRVWHTEGIVALWCLLIAIHEALGRGRVVLVHAWLGLAFLSHTPTVFSLPFFWIVAAHRLREAGVTTSGILRRLVGGVALLGAELVVGWAWYNYARFGNPLETGMIETYRHDVAVGYSPPYGMMSLKHMPYNIWIALLRPVTVSPHWPFLKWDADGFSLFWATPALVYLFWARRPRWLVAASWLGALPVLACLLLYHHHGATQFGYRWVLDFLPFLLILCALGMQRCRWRLARPLIVLSVGINLIGAVWFYAF